MESRTRRPSSRVARSPRAELRLLEGFELTVDGRACVLPPSAERLVAYLALQPRPVVRSQVAGLLWSDRSEERASACLRSTIWRANAGSGARVVEAGRTRVALNPTVVVDASQALRAAHAQFTGGSPVDPAVLSGALLPGWYDDWVMVERERMRQLCLAAMEQMAQSLLQSGQVLLAIEAALSVVTAEPLRESAQRVLIEAHVAAGNRGEALRQFGRCRDQLHAELGLQPGEAVTAAAALAHGPAAVARAARGILSESHSSAAAPA
jgi:DNA-binding SARP family transcriptional activator